MAPDASIPRSERLGIAIVLGVLLLATANNFVTFAIGSRAASIVLIAAPACAGLFFVRARHRRRPSSVGPPAAAWADAGTAVVCAAFLLAIAGRLFFWRSLSSSGLLHPDLPWHIGRVAQQAFLSSPGYWPLSPLAFPGPLPFVSFTGDALVSATVRYWPITIHALTYSQILFLWAMLLWIAVALVAGWGPWGSLTVLTTALLAVPAFMFGLHRVGVILLVFFHANPNSLIAWPVGLAFAFHLQQAFRRRTPPSLLFLILVPPASLFFKANQAFAFGFLQALGFAIWWCYGTRRDAMRWSLCAGAIWAAVILLSFGMGGWPPSRGVHPSIANFMHYAHVALPGPRTPLAYFAHWLSYVVLVAALSWGAARLRRDRDWTRDVVIPVTVLVLALGYLAVGWWVVVPNGLTEGEPMHVNFELIMWIATVTVVGAMDRARVSAAFSASTSVLALAFFGVMVWMLNTQPGPSGGIPMDRNYSVEYESAVRARVSPSIAEGTCFGYGRRFAIDVNGGGDADLVIAATGCAVINGNRWRGYLGRNQPERLRLGPVIPVPSGDAFRLIAITSP